MKSKQRFSTVQQYATLCGVSTQAIYYRVKAGTLTLIEKEDLTGIPRQLVDLDKFPPSKGKKIF